MIVNEEDKRILTILILHYHGRTEDYREKSQPALSAICPKFQTPSYNYSRLIAITPD
jgi:hypothetical protein